MTVNLIFCFLKLAKQIKFQFISVEYCILSPSYYTSEYSFLVSVRRDDLQREYSFLVREDRQLQQVETFPVRPWECMVSEAPSQAN